MPVQTQVQLDSISFIVINKAIFETNAPCLFVLFNDLLISNYCMKVPLICFEWNRKLHSLVSVYYWLPAKGIHEIRDWGYWMWETKPSCWNWWFEFDILQDTKPSGGDMKRFYEMLTVREAEEYLWAKSMGKEKKNRVLIIHYIWWIKTLKRNADLTRKEPKKKKKHFRQGRFGSGLVQVHHSLHLRSPAPVQRRQVDNHP